MFSKHYLFCLDQGNFRSPLSKILILQYPTPRFSLLDSRFQLPYHSRPLCKISPWPTEISLQHNPLHVLHRFSYFVLPYTTTWNIKWINQTKFQSNLLLKYIQINTLTVKQATCQKSEPLRAASLSKLDNTMNSNSSFNTKFAEFSTKCQVLFHFHNTTCACNQPCNLDQKSVPLLHLFLPPYSVHTCP